MKKINITDRTCRIHINKDKNFKMENKYFVKCSITHNPNLEKYNVYPPLSTNESEHNVPKLAMLNLGCCISSLFTPQMWDFDNSWITVKYPRISKHWSKIIGCVKPVNVGLAVGNSVIVN
jgi:hypothetical protein